MTALWTPHDLLEATGGSMQTPFAADGVSIDTRTLADDDLFVALRGEAGDGHAFVADAMAKGAAGAMVHHDVPASGHLLLVDDTLAGLHRLGGYARLRFGGRLLAVTGSVGKTTTKEMLRTILSAFGHTHAAVASYNNHWGLPLTLARLPPAAAFCVTEIGMNHPGEIAPLASLARPHVAVITTIEKAHIGYLGSIEAIADEKAQLLRGLEPGGVAVLPAELATVPATARCRRECPHRHVRCVTHCQCTANRHRIGRRRQRCCGGSPWPSRALPAQRTWAAHGDQRVGSHCRRDRAHDVPARNHHPDRPRTGGICPDRRSRQPPSHPRARRHRVAAGRELQRQSGIHSRGARSAAATTSAAADCRVGRHAGTGRCRSCRTPGAGTRRNRRRASALYLRPSDAGAVRCRAQLAARRACA